MSTNNRISTIVSSQLPDFVRSEHPNFVAFLEAYYEYLEQSNTSIQFGKTVERTKNMLNYLDIDRTIDGFAQKFYDQFLGLIPKDVSVDKAFILKNVKDFYRARGTEKSFRFLFRALFNEEPEFYYPKNDILIASSGKWFIEKSLRITNMTGGDSLESLKNFQSLRVKGVNSGATAIVERVAVSFELPVGQLYELFLSNIVLGNGPLEEDSLRPFENGEQITAIDLDGNTLTATILSGRLETLSIIDSGTGYSIGDPLVFTGDGSGAAAIVSKVSTGNVANVSVVDGGTGFRQGDPILFTGGGGAGASAIVFTVANTANININSDVINTYNATVIGAYSNGANGNANTSLVSTWSTEIMTLGEISSVVVLNPGDNYTSVPFADPVGNTKIKTLGILGELQVNAGGSGYANGELLQFTNVPNGYGFGANGFVTVNSSGSIVSATLTPLSGFLTGGVGYNPNFLPQIGVNTVGGTGANITISSVSAYGTPFTELVVKTTELGRVEALAITSRGANYTTPPSVSITTTTGDGNANVTATVSTGAFTYPGRFLDDTGFPSGFNYLQDRDYYQNYSYVIRVRESIEKYRTYLRDILSPAGFKLWGDYILDKSDELQQQVTMANSTIVSKYSPSLFYNFTEEDEFDGLSYTLLGGGLTYFDQDGVLRTASANTWPMDHDRSSLVSIGRPNFSQRTNLLLYSNNPANSAWTKSSGGTGSAPTITPAYAAGPDGSPGTASRVQLSLNGGTTSSDFSGIRQDFTTTNPHNETKSVWLRSTDGISTYQLQIPNSLGNLGVVTITGQWQRFVLSFTGIATTNFAFVMWLRGTLGTSNSADFLMAWAQAEIGSFVTPYIPTEAIAVTRNAATITTTLGSWFNSTQGTIFARGLKLDIIGGGLVSIDNGVFNESYYITLGTGPGNVVGNIYDGGSAQAVLSAGAWSVGTPISAALSYAVNDFAASLNGSVPTVDTSGTLPTPTTLRIAQDFNAVNNILNGWMQMFAYYPRRLPNTSIQFATGTIGPDDLFGEIPQ
jgi:hypothetical protein